jgi:exosortase A-associated hydrolase 1
MRRLLSFTCEGVTLGASLDESAGSVGILMVTGGSQTRIGSHRMYERLGGDLADAGYSAFRFDRRGTGDSGGGDPGFRGSGPDLIAATEALRRECPHVERVIGFGLCDGATSLAMFGAEAGLHGLILVNPWLVEAESGEPPAAAIKRHYRDRILSFEGWKKLASGKVSYEKLVKGLRKIVSPPPPTLARAVAAGLERSQLPVELILARRDATAVGAEEEWKAPLFRTVRARSGDIRYIESDSHTFARPGDDAALLKATLAAIERLSRRG